MAKTLKQILGEKPILFTADVPERVKEWLMQKRQEKEADRLVKMKESPFTLINPIKQHQVELIDELLKELK